MYRYFSFVIIVFVLLGKINSVFSQTTEKKYGISFSGFIKSDYWYDTRKVVNSREGLFLFYPHNVLLDNNGEDINGQGYVNFSPVTSRLTGKIFTPDAFGAEVSGVIEADFSGVTNADINGFRLRHAYGLLRWINSELLFGQYWHPMFVTEVFPNVISLNTGAPFQPFIRSPQISFTRHFGDLSLNFTSLSQRDNVNDGPEGMSPSYLRNALIPNLCALGQYKAGRHLFGLAFDWKKLRPRVVNSNNEIANAQVVGASAMAYWKYTQGGLTIRAKSIYGQNLTDHLLLGGYAVASCDTISDIEVYTPTNHLFFWGNIQYGKKIVAALFCGYAHNLGTTIENVGIYYSRGSNIAYLYRVAPSISWISGPIQVAFEPEYTVAAYGDADNKGIVRNSTEVGNLRLLLTFFYYF